MPDRSEPRGWYLYGVIDAQPGPDTFSGLDHVRSVRFKDTAALVSNVSLDEFDETQLPARLNDPKWLEHKLWAHQQVLDRVLGMATVVPMKFATIFKSELRLLAALDAHYERILELFKNLKGKHEYGLKVLSKRPLLEAEVEQTHPRVQALKEQLVGQPQGTAYLVRKQFDKLLGEEVEKRLSQHLQTIYERLGGVADERRLNLVTAEQVTTQQAEMVLNAALLVAIDRRAEMLSAVATLEKEFAPRGLTFQLVGPFPPYNFSQLEVRYNE
jgi:hypothetical protein